VYSGASYGFNAPNRVAADGTHVWVTNPPGNSVTELNASNGSPVQVLAGAGYGFAGPWGMAVDGSHIWVTNSGGGSVTELTAR
jgi:DNA-binding beta-propeller fold protein YncE